MENLERNKELEKVLDRLDFKNHYIKKLERCEFYRIEPATLYKNVKCSPAWQFIYNIARYNYRARNIIIEEVNNVDVSEMSLREKQKLRQEQTNKTLHPMDIVVAVFLCCDSVTRQDLIMHMWSCKLAVPFCIQEIPFEDPVVYIWPLMSLVGHVWREDGFVEKPLVEEAMSCVSFIRVGNNEPLSKSYLINCVIWGTEKVHPMFFHRDSEGSNRKRSDIVEGLIEVGWALPGHSEDRFDGPRLFMNLRGDSALHIKQVEIIGQLSSVTVLMCTENNLKKSELLIRQLLERGSKVILFILDKHADETFVNEFIDHFSYKSDARIDAIIKRDTNLPSTVRTLMRNIKEMEKNDTRKILRLSDVNLCQCNVDTAVYPYKIILKHAKTIVKSIQSHEHVDRKRTLFPLQEIYWKNIAKLDQKQYEINRDEKDFSLTQGRVSAVKKDTTSVRKSQFKCIKDKGISKPVLMFIDELSKKDGLYKRIFIRTLKLELDNYSHVQLHPFYKQYKDLVSLLNKAHASERDSIKKQMSELDNMKQSQSIGLEHFMREVGQIYEACEALSQKSYPVGNTHHNVLPKYAVFLLYEGYPLEILDGEVNAVPLKWVNSVVDEMHAITNEQTDREHSNNVHVVSVLGIQSSGKSTLLNNMFGQQFAVSAGRCTKGSFIQLIELAPTLHRKFNARFILLIDTEGLRAAELNSAETIKHDNEFSTLVIGLSDITLINLMGENATYLRDNLPIVVHAFLRMDLVGLHPKCTIVHHNVDKHNKNKLLDEGRKLEDILNDLTKKACDIEKVPCRSFKDMIEFSIEEHTDYIPALFDGELPMAPVSTGYSSEVHSVKLKLFELLHKNKPYLTGGFKPFYKRLHQLWCAIKTDYFVFEFRTMYETEMRLQLDRVYFKIKKKYLTNLKEIMDRNLQIATTKTCKHVPENLKKEIKDLQKKFLTEFDDSSKDSCYISERYETWKSCMRKNLITEMLKDQNISNELRTQYKPIVSNYSFEYFTKLFDEECRNDFTREYAFEQAWLKWVKTTFTNFAELSNAITAHTLKALHNVCHGHEYLLKDDKIRTHSLQDFCPDYEKYTYVEFSWNSKPELTPRQDVNNNIDSTVSVAKDAYKRVLNRCKQNKFTYNHTYPELLLLRVEEEINETLENFDKENQIKIQLKYDLLMHTAGSAIKDFENMCMDLTHIKNELKNLVERKSNTFDDVVFRILTRALDFSFSSDACYLVSRYLSSSDDDIESKQGLLGRCIYNVVQHEDDEMLKHYIRSPKEGALLYIETIMTEIVTQPKFKSCLQSYVNKQYQAITMSIFANTTENVEFGKLLSDISNGKIACPTETFVMEFDMHSSSKTMVNIPELRQTLEKRKTLVMNTETERLHKIICERKNGIIKYCADNLFETIIGCTTTCPFCKEICMYSKNHPDKHQCFVHRPDGIGGCYWEKTNNLCCETCTEHFERNYSFRFKGKWIPFKEYETVFKDWDIVSAQTTEPHKVWKWILVKKYKLLSTIPEVKLPDNLPKEWEEITKAEALSSLREKFEIYSS